MSTGNMRRAQLVSPFGVGSMSVFVNGTSVITAGLDHWYDVEEQSSLALEEYQEHDWRLESRLKVSEFRLPPDWRPRAVGADARNVNLTVPVLRFPRWNFCMYCKRLKKSTLTMQQQEVCGDADHADWKYKPRMSQVPFVAVCRGGHIDDFPFEEWVHRLVSPVCNGELRLLSRGGGGLEGQVVACGYTSKGKSDERLGCGRERSLLGITTTRLGKGGEESTVLTEQLQGRDDPYLCTGARPWLQEPDGDCPLPVRGALRAAGNVYFPKVESSIYLPQQEGAVSAEMHKLMRHPAVSGTMRTLHSVFGGQLDVNVLRQHLEMNVPAELFGPIDDEELLAGYRDLFGVGAGEESAQDDAEDDVLTGDDIWRYPEYKRIRETPRDDFLTASDPGIHPTMRAHFQRVRSVDVLRETRALRGFTRVNDSALKLSDGKSLLRRKPLPPTRDWLPAYVVKGEGLYLELNSDALRAWENRAEVIARAQRIEDLYDVAAQRRGLRERRIEARFVLLHTVGHLLINRLIFECGYSSASLRERMYVSCSAEREMAGLLIYTAAGDSEGTMGGLVRMAKPEALHEVLTSALEDAEWCSTDPVCMEVGEQGQGPESCNLAACHGCALLPETSCEEFNRFLDRGLIVGTLEDRSLGFFSEL